MYPKGLTGGMCAEPLAGDSGLEAAAEPLPASTCTDSLLLPSCADRRRLTPIVQVRTLRP